MDAVNLAQFVDVGVQDGDLRLHALRYPGSVLARHPGAEDHHTSGPDPRHSAEEDPPAAVLPLKVVRSNLGSHAPGNLAHRSEKGEGPVTQLDGLVGHCVSSGLNE